MSKPFDASLKDLIETYPADWLALLGLHTDAPVLAVDADVSTVTGAADRVLQVREDPPWLLHLELQTGPKTDLAEWLLWYNTLVGHRHRQPVRSVLVLLRPAADSPSFTGVYQARFPGEAPYVEFHYRVVRLWQVPVETLLTGGVGLLPLAPLAQGAEARLPSVIQRMEARLTQETPPERAAVLWTTTYVLLGLRYEKALATRLLEGVLAMEESVTYQAIIEKGRQQGALRELRKVVLRLGEKHLGQADAATRAVLEALTDLERLERMSDRVQEVTSWEELLATP